MRIIRTVAAVITNQHNAVLLVRKRGSTIFIQPGGKPETGESPRETLARELLEELNVMVNESTVRYLGEFEDNAVHERNCRVRARVYQCEVVGIPVPSAEIAELIWINPDRKLPTTIAPLSRRQILPRVAAATPCA